MSTLHDDLIMDLYRVGEALEFMAKRNEDVDNGQTLLLSLLGERVHIIACRLDDKETMQKQRHRGKCPI